MNRSGFAPILLIFIVIVVLALGGGALYYTNHRSTTPIAQLPNLQVSEEPTTQLPTNTATGIFLPPAKQSIVQTPPSPTSEGLVMALGDECDKATAGKWPPDESATIHEIYESRYATTSIEVYYLGSQHREGYSCWRITGADPATFGTYNRSYSHLERPSGDPWGGAYVSEWGKDKLRIYYAGKIVSGANAETFQRPYGSWAKDKNNVFYKGIKIEGSNPATFQVIGLGQEDYDIGREWAWAKDKSKVYYLGKPISGADAETIQLIGGSGYWAKDKNRVYYMSNELKGVDASTLRLVGRGIYFYDKSHLYQLSAYRGSSTSTSPVEIVPNIDASTVVSLPTNGPDTYIKDKNAVYVDEGDTDAGLIKIQGADPATFEIVGPCYGAHGISGSYGKDKNQVYCGDKLIEGADSGSFEFLGSPDQEADGPFGLREVAKDKNCIYEGGRKVLDKKGVCVNPKNCTAQNLATSCGISEPY